MIRDAARELEIDEVSRPFPYRETYAIVRIEERHDVDWDALPRYEADIRAYLTGLKRDEESRRFVESLAATRPVVIDEAIIATPPPARRTSSRRERRPSPRPARAADSHRDSPS